jgi:hypothetical protein
MSFLDIVQELASASPALVDVDIEPESADHLLHGAVSVTDEGRRVFAGDADRVRLCGLDRWIGGVHLEGRGPMWRWNDDRERIEMS